MKPKQCVNQSGFAGAVRTKQSNSASPEFALETLQNWPAAKLDTQLVEIDDGREILLIVKAQLFLRCCGYRHAALYTPWP